MRQAGIGKAKLMKRIEIRVSWDRPKVEPSSKAPTNVASNREPIQGPSGRRALLSHPLPPQVIMPWRGIGFQHCARLANACTVRQTATRRAQAINSPVFPPAPVPPANIIEEKVRGTVRLFFYHPGSNFNRANYCCQGQSNGL